MPEEMKFIQITCSATANDVDGEENLYALDAAGKVWWYFNGTEEIGHQPARPAEWRPLPMRRRMAATQADLVHRLKTSLEAVRAQVKRKGIAPRSTNYPLGGGLGYQDLETVEFVEIRVLESVLRMIEETTPARSTTPAKENT